MGQHGLRHPPDAVGDTLQEQPRLRASEPSVLKPVGSALDKFVICFDFLNNFSELVSRYNSYDNGMVCLLCCKGFFLQLHHESFT